MKVTLSRDYQTSSGLLLKRGVEVEITRELYKELLSGGFLLETAMVAKKVEMRIKPKNKPKN
jgi:hypothetical protein